MYDFEKLVGSMSLNVLVSVVGKAEKPNMTITRIVFALSGIFFVVKAFIFLLPTLYKVIVILVCCLIKLLRIEVAAF